MFSLMNSFGVFCLKVLVIVLTLQIVAVASLYAYDLGKRFLENLRVFLRDIYWSVVHRTTKRFNVVHLRTLKPGYYDPDTQILHAVMNLVTDHVEISLSVSVLYRSESEVNFKEWLWLTLPELFSSSEWIRSRSRGLEYLSWEKKLDCLSLPLPERCPTQAQAARTLEEVYLWWKDTRPNRKSAEEVVEWDKFIERRKLWGGTGGYFNIGHIPQHLLDEEQDVMNRAIQIEQDYIDEDKKMLKKIVDILPHIWV